MNGVYFINGRLAGTYAVGFNLASFQRTTNDYVFLTVGGVAEINATMSIAGRAETPECHRRSASPPIAGATLSKAYTKEDVDLLPVGRIGDERRTVPAADSGTESRTVVPRSAWNEVLAA